VCPFGFWIVLNSQMSRVIHFKSEDEVIWSVTHTEAAHYVILKGDKPYRYTY